MWPGVIKEVYAMIETCHVCQRTGRKINIAAPELYPVPVVSPWHHIGIDFIGPLIRTGSHLERLFKKKYHMQCTFSNLHVHVMEYILTISDYFTKFVVAIPMENKFDSGVAASLFKFL